MNNNEKKQDVAKEVTAKDDAVKTKQPAKQILLWLAIVVLAALLAALFWFVQQQQIQTLALIEQSDHSEKFNRELTALQQSLHSEITTTNTRIDVLAAADIDVISKIGNLVKSHQLTNDDVLRTWRLAKVEFLLQAANQQVLLAADIENARAALVLADVELKELADPRMYRLRALIADEQLALASVTIVDVEGISIQLQSALDTVDDLTVLMAAELAGGDMSDTETILPEGWQSAATQAWNEVKSLVVIRHQQDGAAAVLVPEQRYFLYQNLKLKLETAQFALLAGKKSVFNASLSSAEQWLQQYFVGDDRDAMVAVVTALQAESITVEVPDISASLVWLQQKGNQ